MLSVREMTFRKTIKYLYANQLAYYPELCSWNSAVFTSAFMCIAYTYIHIDVQRYREREANLVNLLSVKYLIGRP